MNTTIIELIRQSITLDYRLLKNNNYSIGYKIKFINLKYYLIIKHFFISFKFGESHCKLNGKDFYYDTKYGVAGYNGMLVNHSYLLEMNNINNVSTIIDIGANVGFFSELCRFLYPEANIYAFEPVPDTFNCLKLNFGNDKKTKIYNYAVSNFNGRAKMNFNIEDSALSKLSENGNVDVDVIKLDDFVIHNNIDYVDILKIDTETFENFVLEGAYKTLEYTKYLFIEITIENNNNYTISSLLKLLSTDKYDFQLVGFRNFADKGYGYIPIMDALFKNIKL